MHVTLILSNCHNTAYVFPFQEEPCKILCNKIATKRNLGIKY
jgi:hypothetical protein